MVAALAFAAKEFVAPEVHPAATYPAHEQRKDDHITVAVDPYDTPEKAKIFSVHYAEAGFLPVRLIITNDGDEPISLTELKAELILGRRNKIEAATTDDLYRRFSKPERADRPSMSPIPLPRRKVKGAVSKEVRDEIENAQFAAHAVEPHATQAGFLFFDIQDLSTPLTEGRVDVFGVRNSKGAELMFFEIPLEKAMTIGAAVRPSLTPIGGLLASNFCFTDTQFR